MVTPPEVLGAMGRWGWEDFQSFVRKSWLYAHGTARRLALGDLGVAEEAVQLAYVALWTSWPERCHQQFESNRCYLVGILRYKVVDLCRDRERHRTGRAGPMPRPGGRPAHR